LNRFSLSLLNQHPGRESVAMKRRSCGCVLPHSKMLPRYGRPNLDNLAAFYLPGIGWSPPSRTRSDSCLLDIDYPLC